MTFFYAGLVQGESGGRAISNEDFERIWSALWGNGTDNYQLLGSLDELENTIEGILRRAEGYSKYVGYGEPGTFKVARAYEKLDTVLDSITHIDRSGKPIYKGEGRPSAAATIGAATGQQRPLLPIAPNFTNYQNKTITSDTKDIVIQNQFNDAIAPVLSNMYDFDIKYRRRPYIKF